MSIHAIQRYIERVEGRAVPARISDFEMRIVSGKVWKALREGRKLSVEECALFVKAAAKAALHRRDARVPANWGDYYYLEQENFIAVVNNQGTQVVTVIVPQDAQLASMDSIARRTISVPEASLQEVLSEAPRTFDIILLEGRHERLANLLRRNDPIRRQVRRFADANLPAELAPDLEGYTFELIEIDPLASEEEEIRFEHWLSQQLETDDESTRYEFLVRPKLYKHLLFVIDPLRKSRFPKDAFMHGTVVSVSRRPGSMPARVSLLDDF